MIKKLFILISLLLSLSQFVYADWLGDKYSMFIHYGLYSIPGGVWNSRPVTEGYSEQIFSFGVHFSDQYEALAHQFTAEDFDAEALALLAQQSGMRSIVLTAKHHDGFCLWKTRTTDYNAYDGTPARRDLVQELSEACHRRGMRFGIYFSLIDWHYPYAVPFTSHNADPVTPLHHEYNKKQVTELLSNYGVVDELWFDMASLQEKQSRELYELVHKLQPNCMVSGRVGNDFADFCVMADNEYPNYQMLLPWQTAASMFNETWGYRSWQERGLVSDKVKEKLNSLLRVVATGGKYLLNIGPMPKGGVVPFEKEVLLRMGAFLASVPQAVYETRPSPLGIVADLIPSTLSADGRELYLFVPQGVDRFVLPLFEGILKKIDCINSRIGIKAQGTPQSGMILSFTGKEGGQSPLYGVVRLSFARPIGAILKPFSGKLLTPRTAQCSFAHSSIDYYTGFRSILGYRWVLPLSSRSQKARIFFTEEAEGKTIRLSLSDGKEVQKKFWEERIVLTNGKKERVTTVSLENLVWHRMFSQRSGGRFGVVPQDFVTPNWDVNNPQLQPEQMDLHWNGDAATARYLHYELESKECNLYPVEFGYGEGIMVFLDGQYVAGNMLRPNKDKSLHRLLLLLELPRGVHRLTIKLYNRWGNGDRLSVTPKKNYRRSYVDLELPLFPSPSILEVGKDLASPAARPAGLYNLSVELIRL